MTINSLFKFPVDDDDDVKDSEERTSYKLESTERLELLKETHVIGWRCYILHQVSTR